MCDFSPTEAVNLAAKHKALQDHIITIHFKVNYQILFRKQLLKFEASIH